MSDTVFAPDRIAREPWHGYEAKPGRPDVFDRAFVGATAALLAHRTAARGRACRRIVAAVDRAGRGLADLTDAEVMAAARGAGRAARRGDPARLSLCAPLFACIREASRRRLGIAHRPVQLAGGFAMMRGWLAEMQTGEGKTLTATLAAGAMALAGRPVHVVTVNDYLATRDAEEMGPVYRALGLGVGLVVQGMSPSERQAAYAADVTYCTGKELAFDFLKDRVGRPEGGDLVRRARHAHGTDRGVGLLRGLAFALIDEADSVLIDEARTPLILSAEGPELFDPDLIAAAEYLTRKLGPGDYGVDPAARQVTLTPGGQRKLESGHRRGLLANRRLCEDLVVKALTAQHLFRRDEHYLVRDGKVEIIDEYTGRVMPDRFWNDGLQQMIERKEGLELSRGRVTLARTTYQRFFRRYDRIAGMSGTVREVAGELWRTYNLPVAAIPTHRPVRRRHAAARVLRRAEDKWRMIAAEARALQCQGLAVLIGTPSVAASRMAGAALDEIGVPHVVLSAAQDAGEAAIIAEAGQPGRVTVATNMAGRGADIKLHDNVRRKGGLHVLMSECHDSRRIDRQLAGRAGRQGDPGLFRPILSLDDPLMLRHGGRLARVAGLAVPLGPVRRALLRHAQARAERLNARMRRDLQRQDEILNDAMAFAGTPD